VNCRRRKSRKRSRKIRRSLRRPRSARTGGQGREIHLSFTLGEALDGHFEPAGGRCLDGGDAARQISGAVPGLKREPRAADVQREIVGGEGGTALRRAQAKRLLALLRKPSIALRISSALGGGPNSGHGTQIIARAWLSVRGELWLAHSCVQRSHSPETLRQDVAAEALCGAANPGCSRLSAGSRRS